MNQAIVEEMQKEDSDISSHYEKLYRCCLDQKPKLIVELGVSQSGNSSKIFSMVNEEIGSCIIGVDIVRCPYNFVSNGTFVCRDDIEFAKDFRRLVSQPIDLLFIDTSHEYQHTKNEIRDWFPMLAPDATVLFHDTNLRLHYQRENGTSGIGWDNQRGVIRAIEDHFGRKFDETERVSLELNHDGHTWLFEHWPLCNGFTCLKRDPQSA